MTYAYTNNRLPSIQSVTTLGSGVDGTVQSIVRTYDNLNRVQNITSYASTGGTGTVVNDIQYAYYNGTNKVATSYQSHSGAVNTISTLNVQYTYDTTSTSSVLSNQLRMQTEVHPNSRAIYYDYGSSGSSTAAYNATSTVREIWDGSPMGTGLAVYDYNGSGSRLAVATYPEPSFKLDHFEGTSGTYAALDRFGRVIDQYWKGTGMTADVDRIRYAYDYASSRNYRDIDSAIYSTNNFDQAYTYDGLHRLLTSQVGTLSGTSISGTPTSEEDWTLDGLGNWPGYITKASGTVDLNQTRTASPANEISGISASVGSTWATPSYDAAGNMTTIPKPTALTSAYTATYDAWNRIVSIADGMTTVATYQYDGLNRRIVKGIYVSGSLDHSEHAYFNENWQILEVRKETSGTINSNPLEQYVWHPFYIDAPVLRDYDAATTGSPTRYYYAFDANYNVTACTTSAGSPSERYAYSPYGNVTFLDGSFSVLGTQQSQIANTVTFTGRQFDAETALYLYRNRYYHSPLGVFTGRDPLDYLASDPNLYRYVSSRPTKYVDPHGFQGELAGGEFGAQGALGSALLGMAGKGKECVFTLNTGDSNQSGFDGDANAHSGATIVTGVNNPSLIPGVVKSSKCCTVVIIGHHGGSGSSSGMTISPHGPGPVGIFPVPVMPELPMPDPLSQQIGNAMKSNGCKSCTINIFTCQYGQASEDDAWDNLAFNSGCTVNVNEGKFNTGSNTSVPGGRQGPPPEIPGGGPTILRYPVMVPHLPGVYF